MPATSKAQKGFMGAELGRLRSGVPTETGMSEGQLTDFAKGPAKGLPEHAKTKHHKKKHSPPHSGGGRQPKPRGGGSY
jgi:hypothetical protein